MATFNFTFAFKDGRFCICATHKESKKRSYKTIQCLTNPNFDYWNSSLQMFTQPTAQAAHNNKVLMQLKEFYENADSSGKYNDAKTILNLDVCAVGISQQYTLKAFLQDLIHELKFPQNRKPTKNCQNYITLLHALESEGEIIEESVEKISDIHFKKFGEWIKKRVIPNGKGNNYMALMKTFKASINKARAKGCTEAELTYRFREDAPTSQCNATIAQTIYDKGGQIKSLTPEQYEAFLQQNVSLGNKENGVDASELYKDFCILLYELKSRPMDIICLKWENIAYAKDLQRYVCIYTPAKKKNHSANGKGSDPQSIQYVSEAGAKILMKYKGKSGGGYILPLEMNETHWDLNDPVQFHKFYSQCNKTEGKINKYLHKVGESIGLPFKFTLYALRKSAITHEIMRNKIPLPLIAKTAGTSVEMIENHYTNALQALAKFI